MIAPCKKVFMLFFLMILVGSFLACAEYSGGTSEANVKISGEETKHVAFIDNNGVKCLSIPGVCEAFGFSWKWDFAAQKLTCTKKTQKLVFVQSMPFYLVKDSVMQLTVAPIRQGGMMYLAAELCADVFSQALQSNVLWLPTDESLVVAPIATDTLKKTTLDSVPVASKHAIESVNKTRVERAPQQGIIRTVVIDPGHGGFDPGAIGPDGLHEKKVVLDIGLLLRDIVKKESKLSVYMTRDKDIFIPLQDRTKFANDKKADIFVSIHANSIDGNAKKKEATKGFKIYFLSQAKNDEDKLVAMRENAVIKLEDRADRYDNLQNILINMAGNEYLRESQDFSIMIAESFHNSLKKISRLQLGVGQANFWVLNGAYMPSVLVEVGFISNKTEEAEINDPVMQKSIANGIFEAIKNFNKKFESE